MVMEGGLVDETAVYAKWRTLDETEWQWVFISSINVDRDNGDVLMTWDPDQLKFAPDPAQYLLYICYDLSELNWREYDQDWLTEGLMDFTADTVNVIGEGSALNRNDKAFFKLKAVKRLP
jgi:hypothetical protein